MTKNSVKTGRVRKLKSTQLNFVLGSRVWVICGNAECGK